MRLKYLFLFLMMVPLIALSGNTPQKAIPVKSFSAPVSGWLMAADPLPVIDGRINKRQRIKVSSPDLIFRDETGQYFFIVHPRRNRVDYILSDEKGLQLTSIHVPWNIDLPLPRPLLNKAYRQIELIDISGKITAYDFKGQPVWQKRLVKDYIFTYENSYFAAIANGRIIVVLSYPRSNHSAGFKTMRVIINGKGQILERSQLTELQALQVSLSSDGTYMALMCHNTTESGHTPRTMIFDKNGSMVWQKDIGFRKVVFLKNSNFVVMQKHLVMSFSLQSSKSSWIQEVVDKNFIFDDIAFDGAQTIGMIQGKAGYESGRLYYREARVFFIQSQNGYLQDQILLKNRRYLPSSFRFGGNHTLFVGCETALISIPYQEGNSDGN